MSTHRTENSKHSGFGRKSQSLYLPIHVKNMNKYAIQIIERGVFKDGAEKTKTMRRKCVITRRTDTSISFEMCFLCVFLLRCGMIPAARVFTARAMAFAAFLVCWTAPAALASVLVHYNNNGKEMGKKSRRTREASNCLIQIIRKSVDGKREIAYNR